MMLKLRFVSVYIMVGPNVANVALTSNNQGFPYEWNWYYVMGKWTWSLFHVQSFGIFSHMVGIFYEYYMLTERYFAQRFGAAA